MTTEAKIAAAMAGVEAAVHNADLIEVNIADDTLVAPKDGPIEYRLTNVGEVLPAGGKVFTMLDVDLRVHGHLPADADRGPGQDRR